MDKIFINRFKRIRMFLNEYYFGHSIFFTVLRLIGGPIMFFVGMDFYTNYDTKFSTAFAGIAIFFSIYYTVLPFFWLANHWKTFEDLHFQFQSDNERIIIIQGENESRVNYDQLKSVFGRKRYHVIVLKNNTKLYLPNNQLSESSLSSLGSHLSN